MTENIIELRSVKALLGVKFYIPSYQRGYRWTKQQVTDLLNDIDEFIQKQGADSAEGFYCLQPLVVKENIVAEKEYITGIRELEENTPELLSKTRNLINQYTRWEVIDGQQRLTTIFILLSYLEEASKCEIEYETRKTVVFKVGNEEKIGCHEFLNNICKDGILGDNIDFFHMITAKETVNGWFTKKFESSNNKEEKLKEYKETLLNKVQFIWYESSKEDPIKVFTRLNIGKISLTNAELIKALFLNSANFQGADYQAIRLKQQEIASEWDHIEYTLQNDEFWLFIHDVGYTNPTRIDFLFDLIENQNKLPLFKKTDGKVDEEQKSKTIGKDRYRTFRYFYEYFKSFSKQNSEEKLKDDKTKSIENCWLEVKTVFQTFNEWYNDLELYHYVGYLVEQGAKIKELLGEWANDNQSKVGFLSHLKTQIKDKVKKCSELDAQYEISRPDKGNYQQKTNCKPLLLLHNIQTVINQNKNYKDKSSYGLAVFYKFPFHLYKLESWDVEHIDSNTENVLSDKESQNEYLINIYNAVSESDQKEIEKFINGTTPAKGFDELKFPILEENNLSYEEKNQVWNFTLLDSSTNRSYGNSIFSAKRRIIIGKDKGKLIPIPKIGKKDGNSILVVGEESNATSSFIPPCTKQIFLKYYSSTSSSPNAWDKTDAEAYKQNIFETLKDFGVKIKEEKTSNE